MICVHALVFGDEELKWKSRTRLFCFASSYIRWLVTKGIRTVGSRAQ